MRSLPKIAAALAMTLALSACGTTRIVLPHPDALYPVEMTECRDLPVVPERPAPGEPRSEDAKADYIVDLRTTAVDCKDTVGDWASRRERYVEQWEREEFSAIERGWRAVTGQRGTTPR